MLKATDISSAAFSKSMNGYKQDEVDALLDQIEADYRQFGKIVSDFQTRIGALTKENEELRSTGNSIQNVLVSAQLLADQIVNEAKKNAEEIVAKAEAQAAELRTKAETEAAQADRKTAEAQAQADAQIAARMQEAVQKSEGMITAAHDSVARQQLLFDQIKAQVAAFKQEITRLYKEHAALIDRIPDEVPMDAVHSAEALSALIDEKPQLSQFIPDAAPEASAPQPEPAAETPAEPAPAAEAEPAPTQPEAQPLPTPPAHTGGFQFRAEIPEEKPPEQERETTGGLFRKRNK